MGSYILNEGLKFQCHQTVRKNDNINDKDCCHNDHYSYHYHFCFVNDHYDTKRNVYIKKPDLHAKCPIKVYNILFQWMMPYKYQHIAPCDGLR